MASRQLTIGELAGAAGVPTSTVRYYERSGLLRPSARSASNYRLYSDENLHRLRFIRAAQTCGFTLDDISLLLRPSPCKKVQQVIEDRLDHVEARMKEFRYVRKVLLGSLEQCRQHEQTGRCKVVDELSAQAKRP